MVKRCFLPGKGCLSDRDRRGDIGEIAAAVATEPEEGRIHLTAARTDAP
jgi:hypothetical protein